MILLNMFVFIFPKLIFSQSTNPIDNKVPQATNATTISYSVSNNIYKLNIPNNNFESVYEYWTNYSYAIIDNAYSFYNKPCKMTSLGYVFNSGLNKYAKEIDENTDEILTSDEYQKFCWTKSLDFNMLYGPYDCNSDICNQKSVCNYTNSSLSVFCNCTRGLSGYFCTFNNETYAILLDTASSIMDLLINNVTIYNDNSFMMFVNITRDILVLYDFMETQNTLSFTSRISLLYDKIISSGVVFSTSVKDYLIEFIEFIISVIRKDISTFKLYEIIKSKLSDYDKNLNHGVISYDIQYAANSVYNYTIIKAYKRWSRSLLNLDQYSTIKSNNTILKSFGNTNTLGNSSSTISVKVPTALSASLKTGTYRLSYLQRPKISYIGDRILSTHLVSFSAYNEYKYPISYSYSLKIPIEIRIPFINKLNLTNSKYNVADSCVVYSPDLVNNKLVYNSNCYISLESNVSTCIIFCYDFGNYMCVCHNINPLQLRGVIQITNTITSTSIYLNYLYKLLFFVLLLY